MKSKLFRQSEAFKDSFKVEAMKANMAALLTIATDRIPAFVKAVGDILNASVAERERITQGALPQVGVDRSVFDHACNVAGWLAMEFFPRGNAKGDTPEAIADDMTTLGLITEEQRDPCAAVVSAIKFMAQQEMWSEVEKDRALQKGAPKVVGVETALFFRNVFRKRPAAR